MKENQRCCFSSAMKSQQEKVEKAHEFDLSFTRRQTDVHFHTSPSLRGILGPRRSLKTGNNFSNFCRRESWCFRSEMCLKTSWLCVCVCICARTCDHISLLYFAHFESVACTIKHYFVLFFNPRVWPPPWPLNRQILDLIVTVLLFQYSPENLVKTYFKYKSPKIPAQN